MTYQRKCILCRFNVADQIQWDSLFFSFHLFPSGVATKITHNWFTNFICHKISAACHDTSSLHVCVFGAAFPVQPGRGSNLAPRFNTRSNKDLVEREINNQINLRGGTNNTVRMSTPPHSSANSHEKQKQIHRFEPDYVACRLSSAEISFSFPFPFMLLLLSARWSVVSLSAGLRQALMCRLVDVILRQ